MSLKGTPGPNPGRGLIVQFNLGALITFGLVMVTVAVLAVVGCLMWPARPAANAGPRASARAPGSTGASADAPPAEIPAWGELKTVDLELEQPEEYLAFDLDTNRPPAWFFGKLSVAQIRGLMQDCGLAPAQMERALSPSCLLVTSSNSVVRPDNELVLSLAPETRAKFYAGLARLPGNRYMLFPFCFERGAFASGEDGCGLNAAGVELVNKLAYQRGRAWCFSDYELLVRSLPTGAGRIAVLKALSRQSAVLARLRIRPDTDIDKLLRYWNRGVQVKDVRPLLESLKRLPDGGDISLLYLLPPFARERLYTFPEPAQPGDPAMDCHWSTLNYFNAAPDNRFADPVFTSSHLLTNYYKIPRPGLYGDLVVILDEKGAAIHSGVYLADDLVFTKNGNNYAQPWKLMRLKDLAEVYAVNAQPRMVFCRNKNW